ncbi:MAG: NAD(P)-dependent alcohol dehydrogenase, partial [Paracoccaceae bacterium]
MKAIVYTQYGSPDVLRMEEVPTPTPKQNEVLIRIYASTVNSGDWRARSLTMPAGFGLIGRLVFGTFGPRKPILGTELSGVIDAVGKDVTNFAIGDEVVAFPDIKMGAHAEYIAMKANGLIIAKPKNLSFARAAAIAFGGTTARGFLVDKGAIKPCDKVLVIGASGTTGSATVQLAKHYGANVTGVCSTANAELVKSFGADRVIDYTRENFAGNGELYDIIVDTIGTAPWSISKSSLSPNGRLLVISGSLGDMLRAPFVSRKNGKRLCVGIASTSLEDLQFLVGLARDGIFNPVIVRCYP